jgi:hypothetical protein
MNTSKKMILYTACRESSQRDNAGDHFRGITKMVGLACQPQLRLLDKVTA